MEYTGLIFALFATISWSLGIFPFTQGARRLGVNELNHFRLLLATIVIGIVSFIVAPESFVELFSSDYLTAWIWLGLSGLIGLSIGDHFGFAMYAILGPRLGSVLTTFAPAAALLLGSLLLSENISMLGIIGMSITIIGVITISLGKSERDLVPDHGHGSIAKGVLFGILAALCQGAGLVLAKKGMLSEYMFHHSVHPVHATFIRLLTGTLILHILTLIRGKIVPVYTPVLKNQNNGIRYAMLGTFFGPVFGVTMSIYAVARIDASVAQTIFSLVPVAAIILTYFRHHEKISLKSMTGVLVALLGVFILIWRDKLIQLF